MLCKFGIFDKWHFRLWHYIAICISIYWIFTTGLLINEIFTINIVAYDTWTNEHFYLWYFHQCHFTIDLNFDESFTNDILDQRSFSPGGISPMAFSQMAFKSMKFSQMALSLMTISWIAFPLMTFAWMAFLLFTIFVIIFFTKEGGCGLVKVTKVRLVLRVKCMVI